MSSNSQKPKPAFRSRRTTGPNLRNISCSSDSGVFLKRKRRDKVKSDKQKEGKTKFAARAGLRGDVANVDAVPVRVAAVAAATATATAAGLLITSTTRPDAKTI